MNHYKETFETWNKVASLYEEKFMYLDLYNHSYDIFRNAITKTNATILDIGCGPGNISKYLLLKRPDFNIHGTDIAPNMVELAKKNNPAASFNVLDSREISTLDTKFDGIICGFCLPYLSEADSATLIADTFNLLNDEGVLYLSFVEGEPAESGFKTASSGHRAYFYYHVLDNLIQMLTDTGFEKPQVIKVNYEEKETAEVHTILISKKL